MAERTVYVTVAPPNKSYNIQTNLFQGVAGRQGKSAYEIALDNGFSGTEDEWLESLNGSVSDLNTDVDFLSLYVLSRDN